MSEVTKLHNQIKLAEIKADRIAKTLTLDDLENNRKEIVDRHGFEWFMKIKKFIKESHDRL